MKLEKLSRGQIAKYLEVFTVFKWDSDINKYIQEDIKMETK